MYKKGQILVATKTQYFLCGKTKVHMDAIVKVACDQEERDTVDVFISKSRERINEAFTLNATRGRLREAKPEEVQKWEAGIRNCKGELT